VNTPQKESNWALVPSIVLISIRGRIPKDDPELTTFCLVAGDPNFVKQWTDRKMSLTFLLNIKSSLTFFLKTPCKLLIVSPTLSNVSLMHFYFSYFFVLKLEVELDVFLAIEIIR
jgi:hypothetical protein